MVFNKKNYPLLFAIFIFFLSAQSYAGAKNNLLYTGFTASYDVSKNDFQLGVSNRQLVKKSATDYSYNSFTYATGIASWFVKDKITESSSFQMHDGKITPYRYDYKNSNGKPNDNFSIIFDKTKNTVIRTKDNIKHNIADNKQDLLSFQIAIMLAMQVNDKNIKFTIVDNKKIGEYSLTHTRNENLKTENSEIKTQVLESSSKNNKDRYIFWCAKKYDYLPIKIKRVKQNGDIILIQINKINNQKILFYDPDEEY